MDAASDGGGEKRWRGAKFAITYLLSWWYLPGVHKCQVGGVELAVDNRWRRWLYKYFLQPCNFDEEMFKNAWSGSCFYPLTGSGASIFKEKSGLKHIKARNVYHHTMLITASQRW